MAWGFHAIDTTLIRAQVAALLRAYPNFCFNVRDAKTDARVPGLKTVAILLGEEGCAAAYRWSVCVVLPGCAAVLAWAGGDTVGDQAYRNEHRRAAR